MRLTLCLALAVLSGSGAATAQVPPSPTQPYAGLIDRPIKALSPQQIQGLRMGHGMAMALPAELNRYPGPMHALELADPLALTSDQRRVLDQHMQTMRRAAISLGERLIALEAELDALFAAGTADSAGIDRLTAAIGVVQGELRAAHLRAHVETRAALSDTQVAAYVRLRGYDGGAPAGGHSGHGGHGRH